MVTPTPHAAAILSGLIVGCLTATLAHCATGRPIYVCTQAVPVVFSDRPCGPSAEARVLRVHDPGPGRGPSVAHEPTHEATRPKAGPVAEPRVAEAKPRATDDRCRRLRDERERLDDRMRAGYSAHEAARLWNRWREIDRQIYAARC